MSTKKTIQINPELFKLPGNKTRKNKPTKELSIKPMISPNNLKNKLLKRIKEHKNKELKPNTKSYNTDETKSNYSDEFFGAIDYLSDLSKKQKQEKALYNRTLKAPTPTSINNPQILLDLPPELTETHIKTPSDTIYNINYHVNDDVPYGCLKNGKKKTYREWKELTNPTPPIETSMIRPPTPPKQTNQETNSVLSRETNSALSRETRLEHIKNKLRQIQDQETNNKNKIMEELGVMEKSIQNKNTTNVNLDGLELTDIDDIKPSVPNINDLLNAREQRIENENQKKYFKKTIRRKFTLGKSDKLRRVAVLIKNKQTRKSILDAQKKLKKIDITNVRKHLKQQGLIKVGSTCPADIQRKIFETAMLAGDVNNVNKDTLLHNFLNSDTSEKSH